MKKEIRKYENGIVQITVFDERWYEIPNVGFVPSVTWICDSYPKGIGFYKWLAEKGWDEAEALKMAAADKGSAVHNAIAQLLNGGTVSMNTEFYRETEAVCSPLTREEYEAVLSFVSWYKSVNPQIIQQDYVVFNSKERYAGTCDFLAKIDEEVVLIDFKTSPNIWPSHELQLSAYKHADGHKIAPDSLAILQLGYPRNKNRYKFTQIEDKYDLFLAAWQIWAAENEDVHPKTYEYPEELKL